ncbi:MAG: T9SS type A sorting domain-containing protein [Gemmatimonadetes bacterium]|nr:T9SS type A sorting domain-containing protein [Gemmatimonadota bacterium]
MPAVLAHAAALAAALVATLTALLVFCTTRAHADEYVTENVVLVVIDGLRYSEGLGDSTRRYTPRMAELAELGAKVEPFLNDGVTYTRNAIPAIWCGAWTGIGSFQDEACGGAGNSHTIKPTVFEYYRKHLDRPQRDCAYVLPNVGCVWKPSFDANYGRSYWPYTHPVGRGDRTVYQEALGVIESYAPSFLLLYLSDVDHEGHGGNWEAYLDAIVTADSIVGALWEHLATLEKYAGKTTLLVTNDHGRHDYSFRGHGDGCAGCRTIQLLAIGPDVMPGTISEVPRAIPDIVPTIGELLGFPTEQSTGEPMLELLIAPGNETGGSDTGTGETGEGGEAGETGEEAEGNSFPANWIGSAPNPSTGTSRVRFRTSTEGRARVVLHDLAGRELAEVFAGRPGIGTHLIQRDWRDRSGEPLGAGVYFLTLETETETLTERIVILR